MICKQTAFLRDTWGSNVVVRLFRYRSVLHAAQVHAAQVHAAQMNAAQMNAAQMHDAQMHDDQMHDAQMHAAHVQERISMLLTQNDTCCRFWAM
jgi:hypothetical protein